MERVRRRKLCRNMRHAEVTLKFRKSEKTEYDFNDQIYNNVTCTNDAGLCHPYDDVIHWVHALSDVLTVAERLMREIFHRFNPSPSDPEFSETRFITHALICCFDRKIFYKLLDESHYADKRKTFFQEECKYKPRVAQLEAYRNREIPVCGNYVNFAEVLAEKAKESIACCKKKTERKKHLDKLKLFQAMSLMKSFYP